MKTPQQASSAAYAALLKRKEWKAFSDKFRYFKSNACHVCKRCDKPTHIHHIYYEKDKMPWDYPFDALLLLCSGCHEALHDHLREFRKYAFSYLKPDSFRVLNGALAAGLRIHDPLTFCYAIAGLACNKRLVANLSMDFLTEHMKWPARK